jgi:hypothetical protein
MAAEVAPFCETRLWPSGERGEDQYSMRDDTAAFWRQFSSLLDRKPIRLLMASKTCHAEAQDIGPISLPFEASNM